MPQVEFEPTIPVFERAKTVHALDSVATVIGILIVHLIEMIKDSQTCMVFYVCVSLGSFKKMSPI
jgi:hypothetical protein